MFSIFTRFFKKKTTYSKEFSKIDYWTKWELFELFNDLHQAEKLLFNKVGDNNDSQLLNFKNDFIEELYKLKSENAADFTKIHEWFSPEKEWETMVGQQGKEVGTNIFRITARWKRNQDFFKGAKVLITDQFGVVLDQTEDWNEYGIIRWDSDDENDTQDWRGLFGTFLDMGGEIIDPNHQFTFINDDGTVKKSIANEENLP